MPRPTGVSDGLGVARTIAKAPVTAAPAVGAPAASERECESSASLAPDELSDVDIFDLYAEGEFS